MSLEKYAGKLLNAIVTHYHPIGSSLSVGDILTFLDNSLSEIRAVCANGEVFSLQRIGVALDTKQIDTIVKNVRKLISKSTKTGDALKAEEADHFIQELLKIKSLSGESRFKYIHYK